jgi:hypothetical protein
MQQIYVKMACPRFCIGVALTSAFNISYSFSHGGTRFHLEWMHLNKIFTTQQHKNDNHTGGRIKLNKTYKSPAHVKSLK